MILEKLDEKLCEIKNERNKIFTSKILPFNQLATQVVPALIDAVDIAVYPI